MGTKKTPSTAPIGTKPIHIFKPGRHTTWKGETIEFSQADLEAAAAAYSPALHRAPLVIGHPAIDDPAMGWAASLQADDRGLYAVPEQVDPAFAQEVRDGRWGAVSVKFFRPTDPGNPKPGVWYPRHIGFLGGATPAVKGLEAPAFGADDQGVCFTEGVAFSGWADAANASLWRQVREWWIGKFGLDEADRVVPNYQVQALEQAAQDELREDEAPAAPATAVAFSAPPETTVTPEEKAALLAKTAATEAENQRLHAQLRSAHAAEAAQASVAFCNQLINEGRLLPAYKDVAVATLNHFATQEAPVEFGEGDAKAPLAEGFKKLLQSLPTQVALGEVATAAAAAGQAADVEFAAPGGFSVNVDSLTRHRKATAHMKEHPGVSYIDAVKAVS